MKSILLFLSLFVIASINIHLCANDTIVVPHGLEVKTDGIIQANEWADALSLSVPSISGTIYIKHSDSNLLVAFMDNNMYASSAGIYIDKDNDKATTPQTDDIWIHGSAGPFEWYGNGTDWSSVSPSEWSYFGTHPNEFRISLSKLDVNKDSTNILGVLFSFLDWNTAAMEYTWPHGGHNLLSVPNDWANMIINPFVTDIHTAKDESFDFRIYPNPCSEVLFIECNDEIEIKIQILDSKGSVVYNNAHESQTESIDLKQLSPGSYFVRAVSQYATKSRKLIIK